MPEEQNRILTDHLSTWLFCPTEVAVKNLANEGINQGVHIVGDIMLDASLFYRQILQTEKVKGNFRLNNLNGHTSEILKGSYSLATVHRAENTDNPEKLANIISAFNDLGTNIILPLHPRTRKKILELDLKFNSNVSIIDPVGYLEMLEMEINCNCIITDSGGIQKEAYFLQKPCITLREQTEWVETVESGWNELVGSDANKIAFAFENFIVPQKQLPFYGRGEAGQLILKIIAK